MITCTRRIEFDAAHRVRNHESKCKYLHGHRYAVEATFVTEGLDAIGRVIDFGQVRELLGDWIDNNWDHSAILNSADKEIGEMIEKATGQKVFYLEGNPTAENIAEYLRAVVCPQLFGKSSVRCTRIRLWETPNCYADAEE